MKLTQKSALSLVLVLGMVCSSVLMLTANSAAAAHQGAAQAARGTQTSMVTELPAVVITGKRLTAQEKIQFRSLAQKLDPHA